MYKIKAIIKIKGTATTVNLEGVYVTKFDDCTPEKVRKQSAQYIANEAAKQANVPTENITITVEAEEMMYDFLLVEDQA